MCVKACKLECFLSDVTATLGKCAICVRPAHVKDPPAQGGVKARKENGSVPEPLDPESPCFKQHALMP